MEVAKKGLRDHGRDWHAISAAVGTKSEAQCKNFYFNYKRKFHLDTLIDQFKQDKVRRHQEEGGRTVSISESVASTTTAPSEDDLSTDDEDNAEDNDMTSDTASAPSPAPARLADVEEEPPQEGAAAAAGDTQAKQQEEGKPEEKMDTARATIYPAVRHSHGHILNAVDYDYSS